MTGNSLVIKKSSLLAFLASSKEFDFLASSKGNNKDGEDEFDEIQI